MSSEAFLEQWCGPIEERARLVFEEVPLPRDALTHVAIGDAVASAMGLKPIGFNWELLDADGALGESRSALTVITRATEADMEFPKESWLGEEGARRFAQDFVSLFDAPRTVLSNRLEEYWNPLTDAKIEWAFVGYDASKACLMLLLRD